MPTNVHTAAELQLAALLKATFRYANKQRDRVSYDQAPVTRFVTYDKKPLHF